MKQYLLSVVAAAIISSIVTKLLGSKGTQGAVGKLVAGLFLAFTIVSPFRSVRIGDLPNYRDIFTAEAQVAVEEGKRRTRQALQESIKQSCEAYILDKAQSLKVELEVVVTMSDEDIPVPTSVQLSGNIAPYAKSQLSRMITEDLGIAKEEQKWN